MIRCFCILFFLYISAFHHSGLLIAGETAAHDNLSPGPTAIAQKSISIIPDVNVDISYKEGCFHIRTNNQEMREIFRAIERTVENEEKLIMRIVIDDPSNHPLSLDMSSCNLLPTIQAILAHVKEEKYSVEIDSGIKIKEKGVEKYAGIYNVRKLSPAEKKKQQERIDEHMAKGLAFLKWGSYDDALQEFSVVSSIDPYFLEGEIHRGRIFIKERYYQGAIKTFNDLITRDPTRVECYIYLAYVYFLLEQYDQATKVLGTIPAGIGDENVRRRVDLFNYFLKVMD